MFRRITVLLLLMLSARGAFAQTAAISALHRLVTDTYETKADSLTNAFIESFMIKAKGVFNVTYGNYANNAYWTQAHAIDVLVYNYQRHKGIDASLASSYNRYMTLWYNNKANNYSGASTTDGSYRMFENPFTDDMCWIALTLFHMYEATKNAKYFTASKGVFDSYIIKRAKADDETGGLWLPWNTDSGSGPNACTQSPATLIAAKLYQKTKQDKYLDYAKKLFNYTYQKIIKYGSNGQPDGRVEEPPLTYTQGTFGEACRILFHVTDETATIKNRYRTLAYTFLNYAFTSGRCTNGSNILRDEGHNGDQSIFKAILIPYAVNFVLDEEMPTANRQNLFRNIQKNTTTMWRNLNFSRYPIVFCNWDWTKPYTGTDSDASMGAACCGASLVENYARMCRAINDRYDLGTLYKTCSKLEIIQGHEEDDGWNSFRTAMAKAEEILAAPSDFTVAEFSDAIANLEAAYQEAQDFATGINEINNGGSRIKNDVYDLNGRKWQMSDSQLPRGIYIIGGRKVVMK